MNALHLLNAKKDPLTLVNKEVFEIIGTATLQVLFRNLSKQLQFQIVTTDLQNVFISIDGLNELFKIGRTYSK